MNIFNIIVAGTNNRQARQETGGQESWAGWTEKQVSMQMGRWAETVMSVNQISQLTWKST